MLKSGRARTHGDRPSAGSAFVIGKVVGHYRITAKLGAGGMGQVFLAEDARLDRKAAIKFLPGEVAGDPEARQRFLTEAKAASALNHPHVCVVYDVAASEKPVVRSPSTTTSPSRQ
jgi:serine/threonine protein kinase